jgi:glycosyltransferase involved in cell wall biosynthesis
MRIVYITAGAGGMYCGSCMKDNTLVVALNKLGHDAVLVPTYTPIRTDEEDVSKQRVFYGGINVYLEQKWSLFRWTPWFIDNLLNFRWLLRWVSKRAVNLPGETLGELTLSMLRGEEGRQRKEGLKLVRWLVEEGKPDVIHLTNALLSGLLGQIKKALPNVPVLCSIQGDDIFLDALPEKHRTEAVKLIHDNAARIDLFVATCNYYADHMASLFGVPREKFEVVYPGLNLQGHGGERAPRLDRPFTIGYFARIDPAKGLHHLVDAYLLLRQQPGLPRVRLRVSGWLGDHQKPYLEAQRLKLEGAGLLSEFEYFECPDFSSKVRFLHSLDVLSVPTTYHEPKGLYVLEALANGIPVVQPAHGSFPELIERTGGGVLVKPDDPGALAAALRKLADAPHEAAALGLRGKEVVHRDFSAERMARETVALYERTVSPRRGP